MNIIIIDLYGGHNYTYIQYSYIYIYLHSRLISSMYLTGCEIRARLKLKIEKVFPNDMMGGAEHWGTGAQKN